MYASTYNTKAAAALAAALPIPTAALATTLPLAQPTAAATLPIPTAAPAANAQQLGNNYAIFLQDLNALPTGFTIKNTLAIITAQHVPLGNAGGTLEMFLNMLAAAPQTTHPDTMLYVAASFQ